MFVLSAEQVRAWDQYTMEHEPISSTQLMERAALACTNWIAAQAWEDRSFIIFCGKGNNGGDGLAIARQLRQRSYTVSVWIVDTGSAGTDDFLHNLQLLRQTDVPVQYISEPGHVPAIPSSAILVDAIIGTGLNKPVQGIILDVVQEINASGAAVIAIDMPTGLPADQPADCNRVVKALHTLTFQCWKTGLLVQENAPCTGQLHLLNIELHPAYLNTLSIFAQTIEQATVARIFRPRKVYAHKGTHGHALLIAGSKGKMGAAVLAARAAVFGGAGLTSVLIPSSGNIIMQTALPEAMVILDKDEDQVSSLPAEPDRYQAIGVGPGIGTADQTKSVLHYLLKRYQRPLVLDADALNILASEPEWLSLLPPRSILTPHPKEFDRLFGKHPSSFDRIQTAIQVAEAKQVIIVLKSQHSFIAAPGGLNFFNTTGNAGLAKGGSGDVLTGMLTALLAQGYTAIEAALLGVYLHGYAADLAAETIALESMRATDVVNAFSAAFQNLYTKKQ